MEPSGSENNGLGLPALLLPAIVLFIATLLPQEFSGAADSKKGPLHRLDSRLASLARALSRSSSPGKERQIEKMALENPFITAVNRILPGQRIVPLYCRGTASCPPEGRDTPSWFRKPRGTLSGRETPQDFQEKGSGPFLTAPFFTANGKPGYSVVIPCSGNGFMEMVFSAQGVFGKGSPFLGRIGCLRVMDGNSLVFVSPDFEKGGVVNSIPIEAAILNRTLHLDIPLELQPVYLTGQVAGSILFLITVILLHLHGVNKKRRVRKSPRGSL